VKITGVEVDLVAAGSLRQAQPLSLSVPLHWPITSIGRVMEKRIQ
jgi:hypothetical protein